MDERLLEVRRERHAGTVAPRALDRAGGEEVQTHVLGLRRLLLAAREVHQLRDQRRHLAELLDDVVQQPLALAGRQLAVAREHLDVRAQAGQRRAELVRRIGHELGLRARRFLERAEHRVEAPGETAQLVPALRVDPLREVSGLGHGLGRLGETAHGRERCARDEQTERGRRTRSPPHRSRASIAGCATERVIRLRQRTRDLDCVDGRMKRDGHGGARAARHSCRW